MTGVAAELVGQRFGTRVVVARQNRAEYREAHWRCECTRCKAVSYPTTGQLRRGQQCMCSRRKMYGGGGNNGGGYRRQSDGT